ncbi:MAG: hypothetical protein EOM47_10390 [Bacteroidia bacterium]|nr:hypothetical protein [Bacteroidia bacterium]
MKKTIICFKTHAFDFKRGLSALRFFAFVVAFLGLTASSAWGQTTTIFSENCGTSITGNPSPNSYTGWQNNGALTFTGTGDMRSTNPSSSYTGASGTINVLLNASNEYFQISGINTTGKTSLSLSFGVKKSTTAQNGTTFVLSYSTNGTNFTNIDYGGFSTGSGTAVWVLKTVSLPDGVVAIKFTNTESSGSNGFNIDDIKLVGTLASSPTITTPSPTSLSGFTTSAGTASVSQTFTVGGSNLTTDLVVTAPTGYEVRENGTGSFASSVSFTPSSGTVATKTIEVRIAASAGVGSPAGNVVCSSTGATSQNVAVSGTVSALSYSITPTSNNESFGTVSLSGAVITGAPASGYTYATPAYTVLSGTATVSQSGNAFTVSPTSDCAVRINFEAKPHFTLSLNNDGEAYTNTNFPFTTYEGNTITLPTLDNCSSYTFVGWDTNSSTTSAPTYAGGATYTTTSGNVTLYAVYSQTTGTPETWTKVTALEQIVAGTYIITNGDFYLPNTNTTASNPPAQITLTSKSVSVSGSLLNGTISSDMQWNFTGDNTSMAITSAANPSDILYNINDNNGVRIHTTAASWAFETYSTGFAMKHNSRFCAVYTNGSDWRSYGTKNAANYATNSGILDLFKKSGGSTTTYTTNPNCNAAQVNVSATALSGFTYAQNAGPSAAQSFTVSGLNLTNDISIAAPTNYEISKTSGSGYATPLTFTPAEVATAQTVYVRLKSGLNQGAYNNEVITVTSTGADTKTVTVSGSVTVPINAEPSAHATGFAAVEDGQNAIILSWTDASGADGYLIKASAVSYAAIAAPVDGTPESDATLVKNVAQGTEIVEFTGLSASTTYYFKI